MTYIPSGLPRLSKARSVFDCAADPCLLGRSIDASEVYVGVHDYSPQRSDTGKFLTHLRHQHFTVKYHVVCFFRGRRTDSSSGIHAEVDELEGYDRHGDVARKLLQEYKQPRKSRTP